MIASDLMVIGARERVSFPKFNLKNIDVKIDTGARTSSMYAENIRVYTDADNNQRVSFYLVRYDKKSKFDVKVLACSIVKDSSGAMEFRPKIRTIMCISDQRYVIELTLTSKGGRERSILIGKEAIANRFIVDVSKNYLLRCSDDRF